MLNRQPRHHRRRPDFLLHLTIDGFFQLLVLISRANSRLSRPEIKHLTRNTSTGLLSRRRFVTLQVMERRTGYVIARGRFAVSLTARTANGRFITRVRTVRFMRTLMTFFTSGSLGNNQNNINGVDRSGPHILLVHSRTPNNS